MLQLLLAFAPFVLITYLLVVREVRASIVMFVAYVLTAVSLWLVWQQPVTELVAASAKGLFIAFDLLLIILGVLLIFSLLQATGHLAHLEEFFLSLSQERHVHVVLIGFFFVMFLEGIAGFGTPALIVAPLLVLVGVSALSAVVLALVADSMAVVFGAFGTPIVVGLQGVSADVASVTLLSALLAGVVLLFLPTFMLVLYAYLEGESVESIKQFLPLSLVSGLVASASFIGSAYVFGPELPSVVASLVGLVVVVLLLRWGVLGVSIRRPPIRKALPAIGAYLLAVLLLVLSRANVAGFGSFLERLRWEVEVFGFVEHVFSAYTPGVLLLVSFFVALLVLVPSRKQLVAALSFTCTKASAVLAALLLTLMFAQLIIYSPSPSIAFLLAQVFENTGVLYVFFASLIGAFGSFVAGSATVSNIMFSAVQLDAAALSGVSSSLVLALQTVGAGAGNLVAIHNVVAVLAVVHVAGGVSRVLRVTAVVAGGMCLLVSCLALFLHVAGLA